MIIKFNPIRTDDQVSYLVRGDMLMINGEQFNFSRVEEGDVLPQSAVSSGWMAGDVTRVNGEIELTLLLPNPWNYSQEQAFPVPIHMTVDGVVPLPESLPYITPMSTPTKEPIDD